MFSFDSTSLESTPGSKPAAQRRSRATRDKLINSLDELLQEKNFEAINVTEIAVRAGVSVATIYQRFHNQDAAVAILIALYLRRVTQWWSRFSRDASDQPRPSSLREALVRVARAAEQQIDELQYLMRPAYLQSRHRPDLLDDHWRAQEEQAVSGFHSMLRDYAGEIGHPDLNRAAGMVAYFFNMMFLGRLLHPEGMSAWQVPTADGFAEELADFVCGYLGAPRTADPRGTTAAQEQSTG
jgi:AcrR family transcriptional regulator